MRMAVHAPDSLQRTIEVDLGTPGGPYDLLYDTGSTDLWVLDGKCTDDDCPNGSGYSYTHLPIF